MDKFDDKGHERLSFVIQVSEKSSYLSWNGIPVVDADKSIVKQVRPMSKDKTAREKWSAGFPAHPASRDRDGHAEAQLDALRRTIA